jgi:metal-responsive CopG/Arc/MetJ family transcriptional regulator
MARVNVFLKDDLLDEINREADIEKTNRSSLIQNALEEYLHTKRRQREEEEKRKKMREASRGIDQLAKELGDWDPIPVIRRFRDTNLKGE